MKLERFAATLAGAKLGIDIGRVIMCPAHDDGSPDTSFLSASEYEAMQVPAAPHAFEIIQRLVTQLNGRVWLVSKCGERVRGMTWRWLDAQRFYSSTGLMTTNVRFCKQRNEKKIIAEELGLTHFIDDRQDVLGYLRGSVEQLALFGVQPAGIPDWVAHMPDWASLGRELDRA